MTLCPGMYVLLPSPGPGPRPVGSMEARMEGRKPTDTRANVSRRGEPQLVLGGHCDAKQHIPKYLFDRPSYQLLPRV
jgi:hypothetical protein